MINEVEWMRIPQEIRQKLVEVFRIPRSGTSIVESNVVKTDGRTQEDLIIITIDRLRDFVGLDIGMVKSWDELFALAIEKIQEPDKPTELQEKPKDDSFLCVICGFKSKSDRGLKIHNSKHK